VLRALPRGSRITDTEDVVMQRRSDSAVLLGVATGAEEQPWKQW
jgi:hypothetical protein